MQFLASLAQIIFGGSALWIAILQWKISKNKSKFEAYDKRYEAYSGLTKFLGSIVQTTKFDAQNLVSFHWKFQEHFFFFGKDVHDYVNLINEKVLEHNSYEIRLWGFNPLPAGNARDEALKKQKEIFNWLVTQEKENKKYFEKYLRIE